MFYLSCLFERARFTRPTALVSSLCSGVVACSCLSFAPASLSASPISSVIKGGASEGGAALTPALAPARSAWVSYREESPQTSPQLSTEAMLDPKQLLALIKARPEALNVSQMPSVGLALEVAQLLLFNGEPTRGVEVLLQARERWPRDPNVSFAWARAMISVGAPSYGRPPLEELLASASAQPTEPSHGAPQMSAHMNYARYLLALCFFLEGEQEPATLGKTLTLLDEVLASDPHYVGPDGMTADKLRAFSADVRRRLEGATPKSDFTH